MTWADGFRFIGAMPIVGLILNVLFLVVNIYWLVLAFNGRDGEWLARADMEVLDPATGELLLDGSGAVVLDGGSLHNDGTLVFAGTGVYDLPGLEDVREERIATPWGEPSDQILHGRIGAIEVRFLPRPKPRSSIAAETASMRSKVPSSSGIRIEVRFRSRTRRGAARLVSRPRACCAAEMVRNSRCTSGM